MMKTWLYALPRWVSSHQRQALIVVTLSILSVHLLSVVLLSSDDLGPDEQGYVLMAENLLSTGTFGMEPGVPFALYPPLHPILVAVLLAVSGHSLLAVRIAQAIMGTASSLVTFGLARTLFPERPAIAWLSMLCVGLYPVFFLWEGLILTETAYILLVQLCCWWWVRSVQRPAPATILLAGVGFGLSMWVRETLYFFVPAAVVAALVVIRGRRLLYVVLFLVAYLAVLAPWMVRNVLVFDHLFFTERTAYLTYSLTGQGYLSPFYQERNAERAQLGTAPQALDLDDLAYTPVRYVRSLSFARQEPVLYARILVARFLELWGHPNGLNRLPGPLRLPYQLGHGAILLLAGGGLWAAFRKRHWPLLAWCLVLPYVTVVSIYFQPSPRYTLPFLPLVFVLAVLGVVSIVEFLQRRVAIVGQTTGRM